MKTTTVHVAYTGWDWDDTYVMKSPTGKVLRVKPNGHWSHGDAPQDCKLTEAEETVLQRIKDVYSGPDAPRWSEFDRHPLEVTYEEMRLFRSASQKTMAPPRGEIRYHSPDLR